jgi:hypothetical protein
MVCQLYIIQPLELGKDFKMPLFVLAADSGISVGDTAITIASAFPLWTSGVVSNTLNYRDVNYLNQGIVFPETGKYHIKLSWNANILGQFADWNITAKDSGLVLLSTNDAIAPTVTSIAPLPLDPGVLIFPNPASHYASVLAKAVDQIEVFNTAGARVQVTASPLIDCSQLTNGTYFVRIKRGHQTTVKSLIVVH